MKFSNVKNAMITKDCIVLYNSLIDQVLIYRKDCVNLQVNSDVDIDIEDYQIKL